MPTSASPFESALGSGAMLNWISIAEEDAARYEDWYNFQHLPERVSTPGFLRARRFAALDDRVPGVHDHLTVYETADAEVLASPEYLRRLDAPTELTRQVVPLFREFRRTVARSRTVGNGSAGRVAMLDVEPAGADVTALLAAAEDLIADHRVHTATVFEPDTALAEAKNATAEGRGSTQQTTGEHLALLLELQTAVAADAVVADLVGAAVLPPDSSAREYALVFELRSITTAPKEDR